MRALIPRYHQPWHHDSMNQSDGKGWLCMAQSSKKKHRLVNSQAFALVQIGCHRSYWWMPHWWMLSVSFGLGHGLTIPGRQSKARHGVRPSMPCICCEQIAHSWFPRSKKKFSDSCTCVADRQNADLKTRTSLINSYILLTIFTMLVCSWSLSANLWLCHSYVFVYSQKCCANLVATCSNCLVGKQEGNALDGVFTPDKRLCKVKEPVNFRFQMAPSVWTNWRSFQSQIAFQWHRPNQIKVKPETITYLPKPVHVVSQEEVIS